MSGGGNQGQGGNEDHWGGSKTSHVLWAGEVKARGLGLKARERVGHGEGNQGVGRSVS